jgi:hypothetical protein
MRVHTSHQCYGFPPFMLHPSQWTHENPFYSSWHFCYHSMKCQFPCQIRTTTCISFNHIPLLSSMNRHYVHQRWNSHLSWHCHCQPNTSKFTSLILHNLKICCLWSSSSQKKELSRPTPHWSIPPFRTHPPSPLLIFYK